jgi:hypothetical protein
MVLLPLQERVAQWMEVKPQTDRYLPQKEPLLLTVPQELPSKVYPKDVIVPLDLWIESNPHRQPRLIVL